LTETKLSAKVQLKVKPEVKKEQKIKKNGVVLEALPAATFRVQLEDGKEVLCHLAGKMRIHRIKILPGDKVVVEFGSYDEEKGRIVYRSH